MTNTAIIKDILQKAKVENGRVAVDVEVLEKVIEQDTKLRDLHSVAIEDNLLLTYKQLLEMDGECVYLEIKDELLPEVFAALIEVEEDPIEEKKVGIWLTNSYGGRSCYTKDSDMVDFNVYRHKPEIKKDSVCVPFV